ncbi:MAG TPA: hypothetical protein VFR85_11355 [Anaeromyxobacteraceae bacterium]|nr:hypothetical protein [Anaeromyxobacteraceae bacterium]
MRARSLLRSALVGSAALVLMGHTPYRQWAVYRETHLLIVADGSAAGAAASCEAVVRVIAASLPRSGAAAAEAHSAAETVRLLRSRQLRLGLLLADDAADALLGRGLFAGEPPLPLRALAAVGPYRLVVLDDFPEVRAAEIARALAEQRPEGAPPVSSSAAPVPMHPGAAGSPPPTPARS